jgi:hypothetical protein
MAVVTVFASGCALFTDLSGLSGGRETAPVSDAASDDAPPSPPDADADTEAPADAAVDAAEAGFFDDFARPEADDLGNGWTEKSPQTFALIGGTARRTAAFTTDYRDNLVYRPAAEDRRDVEVAIEFTSGLAGAPQVFVRVERATLGIADSYNGYVVYVADGNVVSLGRQTGTSYVVDLRTAALIPAVQSSQRHRLRARVRGSIRVIFDVVVERFEAGAWQTLGSLHHEDDRPERLADAGALGFAATLSNDGPIYDHFSWRPLDPP